MYCRQTILLYTLCSRLELIRLQRIYFSAFPLVLDSILHDLNETNPRLTLFSAELPWCCFCAEIKVLGMERNFARNFYTINKNFWRQDPLEGGTWVGNTHQGAPPSWRAQVGCTHLVPLSGRSWLQKFLLLI